MIRFTEGNENGRLENAFFTVCGRGSCAQGTLKRSDGGTDYDLTLESLGDGGGPTIHASVQTAPAAAGSLLFAFQFALDVLVAGKQPVDGDVYTVVARVSDRGATLFEKSFTATYQTIDVCGVMCKSYTVGP